MSKTYASLFTGGGLADVGAAAAGLKPIWGIENVDWIAAWASQELKHDVMCLDILKVDPKTLEAPYHLHASPPCPNFSVAKASRVEGELDIALAKKVAEFIRVLKPKHFTLENVWGYRKSQSWEIILKQLRLSYGDNVDFTHVNFADLGVPQTRKRMIVRASLDPLAPLPEKEPWIGWYAAIEDLIPTLPDSQFAPWQLERLAAAGITFDAEFLLPSGNKNSARARGAEEPAQTIGDKGRVGNIPKAFLVNHNQSGDNGAEVRTRNEDNPAFAVTAKGSPGRTKAYLLGQGSRSPLVPDNKPATTITSNRNQGFIRAHLAPVQGANSTGRPDTAPAPVIAANHDASKYRAFVVGRTKDGYGSRVTVRMEEEPFMAVASSHWKHGQRAAVHGRVVAMTPRALARFQSLPDWYQLPEKKSQAVHMIGNGVPSLGMKKIIEGMNA